MIKKEKWFDPADSICESWKPTISNAEKGDLGEDAFAEALPDFPMIRNIMFGKRQNDIDHLVLTSNYLVFNECKNTNENFFAHYSWFLSHILARFVYGLPIAQYYAKTLGYSSNQIKFLLTIPKLNTNSHVIKVLKSLNIDVIETEIQILSEESKGHWSSFIRNGLLSVINNIEDVWVGPTPYLQDKKIDYEAHLDDFLMNGRERLSDFLALKDKDYLKLEKELRRRLHPNSFGFRHYFRVWTDNSWFGYTKYLNMFVKSMVFSTSSLSPERDYHESRVFHGTSSKFYERIKREGLDPAKFRKRKGNEEKKVWLTNNLYIAELYAVDASISEGDPMIVVVDFNSSLFDLSWSKNTLGRYMSVFDVSFQFSSKYVVKPERIQNYYRLPKNMMLCEKFQRMRDRLE